jgi:hypothetical protein
MRLDPPVAAQVEQQRTHHLEEGISVQLDQIHDHIVQAKAPVRTI